jgi:hypothetical protein
VAGKAIRSTSMRLLLRGGAERRFSAFGRKGRKRSYGEIHLGYIRSLIGYDWVANRASAFDFVCGRSADGEMYTFSLLQ